MDVKYTLSDQEEAAVKDAVSRAGQDPAPTVDDYLKSIVQSRMSTEVASHRSRIIKDLQQSWDKVPIDKQGVMVDIVATAKAVLVQG